MGGPGRGHWWRAHALRPGRPVDDSGEETRRGDTGYRSLVIALPKEVKDLFLQVAESVRSEMVLANAMVSKNPKAFHGQVLEVLVAEYLATKGLEQ